MVQGEDVKDHEDVSDPETTENMPSMNSRTEDSVEEENEVDESQGPNVTCDDFTSEADWQTCSEASGDEDDEKRHDCAFYNSSHLLRKDELLEMFMSVHSGPRCKEDHLTVGLVCLNL